MRIAIYTRLSPRFGTKKVEDTVNQERDLLKFADANGWEVYKIYKDIWVSGAKKGKDRPQFKLMMEEAYQKKFDLVLFWSLDRFSREGARETLVYLTQLDSWGINYKSYTEQFLDSAGVFKDAVITLMATFAKLERNKVIERTLVGLQTARDKGVKLGRKNKLVDLRVATDMRREGKTLIEIAKKCNVSEATMSRLLRKDKARAFIMEDVK